VRERERRGGRKIVKYENGLRFVEHLKHETRLPFRHVFLVGLTLQITEDGKRANYYNYISVDGSLVML
jgi:hypothetical protein